MSRNRIIATVAVVLTAAVLLGFLWAAVSGDRHVNLLLITLDTTRADRLGCYGYEQALTPHLDALSAAGALFEQAYCTVPLTSPSHATMLTGLQPPEHGLRTNGAQRLDASVPKLAAVLQENGYQTAAFIAAFALDSKFGLDRGFDIYDDDLSGAYAQQFEDAFSVYRSGDLVTEAALAWLEEQPNEPFFCWVHLYDPHMPYYTHQALVGTQFHGRKSYDAEVAFMDMQVGRLMAFLKQRKLLERMLVIAVGDHGEGLGDHGESAHGYTLYDSTLRVPLIISRPGHVPQAARTPAMVSLVDLFPTILDLLGIPLSKEQAERSFKSAVHGGHIDSPTLYAETELPYTDQGWSPLRCLITRRWKYIRTARVELYDRQADPAELNNLVGDRPDLVAQLEGGLADLESRMTHHAAQPVEMTPEDISRLEALGYVGGAQPLEDVGELDLASLPDVKDMLPLSRLNGRRRAAIYLGQMDKAVELCQEMIRLAPDSAQVRLYLGDTLRVAGRLEEAEHAYRQAIQIEESAQAHCSLGLVLASLDQLDKAADCYARALSLNPKYVEAHNNLGGVLITAGRPDEAVEHLSEALRLKPDYVDAHYNMARARALQQDFVQAIAHYQQVLQLVPDRLDALNALAWLLATHEGLSNPDGAQAVSLAERACEFTGHQEPALLDTLAAAYADAGLFSQAVDTAKKALTLALSRGQENLEGAIRDRLELYKAHRPYREPP